MHKNPYGQKTQPKLKTFQQNDLRFVEEVDLGRLTKACRFPMPPSTRCNPEKWPIRRQKPFTKSA